MAKKIQKNTKRFYPLVQVLMGMWPLLFVLLFALAGIIHISISPEWRETYLYSGDSTTLAAFVRSIQSGESQQWIFSSQIFFFPEGVLYGVSSLLTQSIYSSLVLNSVLNIVAAYFLFYWIGKQLFDTKVKSQFFSIFGIAIICGYTLLELHPTVNQSAIVTLFFFTTYYYGIVVSSLGLLALSLFILKSPSQKHVYIAAGASSIITALTAASNPLLMLQFSLPYILTLLLLFFINRLRGRTAVLLIGTQIIGLIAAQILRIPFKKMIGLSANSYINVDNIPRAIHQLKQTVLLITTSGSSIVEYMIMCSIILFSVCYALWLLYRCFRSQTFMKQQEYVLFAVIFGALSPEAIVLSTLLTGNSYTRYFLPIAFFPLVAIFAGAAQLKVVSTSVLKTIAFITSGLFLIYCLYALPHSQPLTHAVSSDAIECFEQSIGNRTINAVGSFWSSRPLDLYSDPKKVRVVQVNNQLAPYPWLNDRADYNRLFDTVIVDKATPLISNLGVQDVSVLGAPSQIWTCPDFYIYHYDINSPGYENLNGRIHH